MCTSFCATLNVMTKKQVYSEKAIIAALRKVGTRQELMTTTDYQEKREADMPHPMTIISRYGTWANALHEAGLPYAARQRRRAISDDECLEAVRRCKETWGYWPTYRVYNDWYHQFGGPSPATIRARFSRWQLAVEEAQK